MNKQFFIIMLASLARIQAADTQQALLQDPQEGSLLKKYTTSDDTQKLNREIGSLSRSQQQKLKSLAQQFDKKEMEIAEQVKNIVLKLLQGRDPRITMNDIKLENIDLEGAELINLINLQERNRK